LERHAARKRSARDDRRRIAQHILPAWGHRKVDSITRADVAALHSKIGQQAPYEANRTVALCSKVFELARRWGFVPENAANPARGIDKFREQKRDRWVTPEELPRLAAAIAQDPNLYVRAAICEVAAFGRVEVGVEVEAPLVVALEQHHAARGGAVSRRGDQAHGVGARLPVPGVELG